MLHEIALWVFATIYTITALSTWLGYLIARSRERKLNAMLKTLNLSNANRKVRINPIRVRNLVPLTGLALLALAGLFVR